MKTTNRMPKAIAIVVKTFSHANLSLINN